MRGGRETWSLTSSVTLGVFLTSLVFRWFFLGYSYSYNFFFFFGCARSLFLRRLCSSCSVGLLIMVASLVAEHRPLGTGSIVVAHGLGCSTACGIFLDQGLNLCLLHWPVDSLPLSHQGSPSGALEGGAYSNCTPAL